MSEKTEAETAAGFPLSDYARSLEVYARKRYYEKIEPVGIDPFLLSEKDLDSECLPPVESIDVVSFLVSSGNEPLHAYNQMVSGFIKTVQGRVIADNFVVIGKVRHSQKMNDPCVPLWIITNKTGTILSAHCRGCMAGLGECCSHIASVLFFLETFNRIREKLSCTEMKCAWILPSYAKDASFAEVKDINFKSAKKLKQELDRTLENLNPSCASEPLQFTVKTDKKTPTTPSPDSSELNEFFAGLDLCKNKPVVLSIIYPYSQSFVPKSSHIRPITDLFDKAYLDMEYHELLEACSNIKLELSKEDLKLIEEDTRSQAAGSQFFHHRAGRIGASVSKQASHTDPAQPSTSLIKRICYPSIFKFSTTATEYGCKHESLALKAYENIMKQNHVNFKIEKCGMFVSAEYPWIHGTPDFLCACNCCGQGCGEIKCPYCLKDADFISYTEKPSSCLSLNGGKYMLRRNHQYYYQVQQQLFTSGRAYDDFVVYRPSNNQVELVVERVYPNNEHWKSVLPRLTHFWRYCILPEILG